MNTQWMKTKIPQTLTNMKIDAECWTFLRPLDAAHATPDGIPGGATGTVPEAELFGASA